MSLCFKINFCMREKTCKYFKKDSIGGKNGSVYTSRTELEGRDVSLTKSSSILIKSSSILTKSSSILTKN